MAFGFCVQPFCVDCVMYCNSFTFGGLHLILLCVCLLLFASCAFVFSRLPVVFRLCFDVL